jgi:predicted DNA-binding protein YlxM (UPF0122 family)
MAAPNDDVAFPDDDEQQNETPRTPANTSYTPAAATPSLATSASIMSSGDPNSGAAASSTCNCPSCPGRTQANEVASLLAQLVQLRAENNVLRSTSSGGGGLGMAFKLLDGLKLERDALKRENAELKERVSRAGAQTPLEQLLAHEDLAPSTKAVVLALPANIQETLATDLARWNLRAPTDAHGNPYDVNRRAMHIAKTLQKKLAEGGVISPPAPSAVKAPSASPTNADASASPPSALGAPTASPSSITPPAGSPDDNDSDMDDAGTQPRRKRLVVAKAPNPSMPGLSDEEDSFSPRHDQHASTEVSPSPHHSPLINAQATPQSAATPTSSNSANNSQDKPSHLSTSLLAETNRLIFQEDSPLYRQQLQLQRVRVAQLFARLDTLVDGTRKFVQASEYFAKAAKEWSKLLAKPWEDVEARETIDEQQAVKLEQKLREEAAKEQVKTPAAGTTPSQSPPAPTTSTSSPSTLPLPRAPVASSSHSSLSVLLPVAASGIRPSVSARASPSRGPTPAPSGSPPPSASAGGGSGSMSSLGLPPPVLLRASSVDGSGPIDPLSMQFAFTRLSALVSTVSQSSHNLSQFLSHIFLTGLSSIGDTYRSEAKSTMLRMERIMEEYEEKLSVYLKKKQKDRLRILNMKNIFGKKKMIDEEHMYICALRREMELRRLDHVELLNTLMTSRRLELIEITSASFMSFNTFFHECDFASQELKPDLDIIQLSLGRRKRWYEEHLEEVAELREQIKLSALPMNLTKIFSSPPSLPIGMNQTDWLQTISQPATGTVGAKADAPGQTPTQNGAATPGKPDLSSQSSTPTAEKSPLLSNIGHASLIYTIPGIGVASSLSKPAQVQGYLRTLTRDGKAWKRRWHVLEKGQFFYLRESAFLQPRFIVNVLTCGARPCVKSDMDFVFELISPTKTILYQAESEHEMRTWVQVFANSTEYLLSLQQTRTDTEALSKNMDTKSLQLQKHLKQGLLTTLRKENPTCAEVS